MILLDPLIGVRAVHFAATVFVAGTIFFRHLIAGPVLRREDRGVPALVHLETRLNAMAAIMLAVAFVSGAAWLVLESAAISDLPLAEVYSENVAWTVLTETRFGHVCALRGLVALLLAFLAISVIFRKAFCSWLCPIGTLSEALWKLGRRVFGRNRALPRAADLALRSLKYILLGLFGYAVYSMSAPDIAAFMEGPYGVVADVKVRLGTEPDGPVRRLVRLRRPRHGLTVLRHSTKRARR